MQRRLVLCLLECPPVEVARGGSPNYPIHTDVEGRWAQRNATAWYVSDVRGSTIALMGRHGNTEASYKYDAYGLVYGRGAVERQITAIPGRPSTFKRGTDYLYTGKRQVAATGLYDYGFRDYAPRLARFTSVDPIKDGRNWYAYVGADPVNLVDPLGLLSAEDGEASAEDRGGLPGNLSDRTAELIAGAETALVGAGMISAGATAIKGTLVAVGVTAGTAAATTVVIAGTVVLPGIGLVFVGIDLIQGDGLDRTSNIIDRVRNRPERRF